jgi:glutaminase
MFSSLRKRYGRSRSVNEYDLEHNNGGNDTRKSTFSMFNQTCHRVTSTYSPQRVHSEPTRRKFGSGLQLNRSKSNSMKRKCSYGTIPSAESSRSLESQDFVSSSSNRLSDKESEAESSQVSVSSLPTSRRLAICTELEKETYMENGENLLISHKNLVIRDFLENYAYI